MRQQEDLAENTATATLLGPGTLGSKALFCHG